MKSSEDSDKYLVPGLARGLATLELFNHETPQLSLSEIAECLGINRSSAFRIVYTLEKQGFLRKHDDKHYSLGLKNLQIGSHLMNGVAINHHALPIMKALLHEMDVAVHLSTLDGVDIVFINSLQSLGLFTSNIRVGSRWPAYATAIGHLLLGGISDEEIRRRFEGANDWHAYSDSTPTSIDELLARVHHARENDYLISNQKFRKNMLACAAAVYNPQDQRVKYVLSVSCPAMIYTPEAFEKTVAPKVVKAAQQIAPFACL